MTLYGSRIRDWSADVCSSDLDADRRRAAVADRPAHARIPAPVGAAVAPRADPDGSGGHAGGRGGVHHLQPVEPAHVFAADHRAGPAFPNDIIRKYAAPPPKELRRSASTPSSPPARRN